MLLSLKSLVFALPVDCLHGCMLRRMTAEERSNGFRWGCQIYPGFALLGVLLKRRMRFWGLLNSSFEC